MQADAQAVLRVDPTGCVTGANQPARELLGARTGRRCLDVIAARCLDGAPHCGPDCVASLTAAAPLRDLAAGIVRGCRARVRCERIGDEVVVMLHLAGPAELAPRLTPREREVLCLVAAGLTAPRIADRLAVHTSTVRTHMEHIRDKLGARTCAHAVALARAAGEIP